MAKTHLTTLERSRRPVDKAPTKKTFIWPFSRGDVMEKAPLALVMASVMVFSLCGSQAHGVGEGDIRN